MLVDFYQRLTTSVEALVASLAGKILNEDGRLLVVDDDPSSLARLDRLLWDQGETMFLPHALAGGTDDSRQPILLSTGVVAPNLARNLVIADGTWRDSATGFDRAFFIFDEEKVKAARLAWKLLSGREGVERRYWSEADGRWTQQA